MATMTAPDSSFVERLAEQAQRWNAHASLRALGAELSYPNGSAVRIEVNQISPALRGGLGDDAVVNGGALSAVCDLIIGSTSALVEMSSSATVQLSIRFERPLRGERIVGEARVDHHTGRTLFASAEIRDELGNVCVRCQGIVALLGKRPG
jgi:acyl-coenzyme A thioesterase PaaI-like protein